MSEILRRDERSSQVLPVYTADTFLQAFDCNVQSVRSGMEGSTTAEVMVLLRRQAIITPLLRKSSLDPVELMNYRPVSNLTFMSKIVEKLVSAQLQSAYRRHHSTETAILRVMSDLLSAADNRRQTGDTERLLDLSAAFD